MDDIFIIILIGAITGFSSGMFGIGGSVIATPLLSLFLGVPPLIALATPLPAAIPSAASGSILYHKNKMIAYKIALPALAAAIPFAYLASWLTDYIDGSILLILKAVFLSALGIKFVVCAFFINLKPHEPALNIGKSLVAGAIAGFISGIIAVGGGIILVTAFVRINYLSMKQAVATSLFCIAILAIVNSYKHYDMGHIDLETSGILALTVIPFSLLGAKMTVLMQNKTLEKAFGISLIIFAMFFIYMQLNF